jgi:uncharacterized membrane protein YkvA (DUF1232 family)
MSNTPDLKNETVNLPATVSRNEKTVRKGFWPKMTKVLARIPFADNAVAAYYCAFDPQTPTRVRAILLAALAYFIMPIDVVPDMLIGIGFTDDMAVLATAYGLINKHIKQEHFDKAREKLAELKNQS